LSVIISDSGASETNGLVEVWRAWPRPRRRPGWPAATPAP